MNKLKNQINPNKLLLSKWTAVKPLNKEKHFIVVKVNLDEQDLISTCILEALINKLEIVINWQCLQDQETWLTGWQ